MKVLHDRGDKYKESVLYAVLHYGFFIAKIINTGTIELIASLI